MIEVHGLGKRYGAVTALEDVSFEVGRGQVVGLLGPNGAGKTTCMRILACYLSPTSGTARLAGHDVREDALGVRRALGYLPESVPLYPEMRVDEYLRWRARLRRLPRARRRPAIDRAVELCGLGSVRPKLMGQLSKGFRQRVGLADALLHQPPVLVLDEPTEGLDPNQIREVRQLVRDLGREHTVLLSTHILPEVEATCGRVLIIHRGRLVASDAPGRLRDRLEGRTRVACEVTGPAPAVREALGRIAGVRSVSEDGVGGRYLIDVEPGRDVREEVFRAVVAGGWTLRELRGDTVSLEDVFVKITRGEGEAASPAGAAPPERAG